MTFTPSDEQIACRVAAVETEDNLLISALAGAAKTSTLVLIMNALPKVNGLVLAFNKRIATEMQTKCPPNFTAQTLNSLGHRAWADVCGRRLILNSRKNYQILSDYIDSLGTDAERKKAWESSSFVLRSAGQAKSAGHVPNSIFNSRKCQRIMDDDELFAALEEVPTLLEEQMLLHVLTCSMEMAFNGEIDFDDQLLMPTCFRASFPRYQLVMVDEAQDLSELNHMMLQKLVRKRIIAVGDQCQAIYGFRGAHSEGMKEMKSRFDMTELQLSCSFRCPEAIVRHVQWRAPHMTWWEGNPHKGSVRRLQEWSITNLPDNCAVICRNNAPLFRFALLSFRHGRLPNLWGNDIGKGLLALMKKLGPLNMQKSAALEQLAAWYEGQAAKARNKSTLRDRMECVKIFIEETNTLGAAVDRAQHILNAEGKLNFLTAHKAKGHEFSDVYILDEEIISDKGQDPNVRYVAVTRSMENLTYIETGFNIEMIAREEEAAANA